MVNQDSSWPATPPSPNAATEEADQKKRSFSTSILAAMMVVIILALLGYKMYGQNKHSDVSNWKTYTNNPGHYTIQYPSNYVFDLSDVYNVKPEDLWEITLVDPNPPQDEIHFAVTTAEETVSDGSAQAISRLFKDEIIIPAFMTLEMMAKIQYDWNTYNYDHPETRKESTPPAPTSLNGHDAYAYTVNSDSFILPGLGASTYSAINRKTIVTTDNKGKYYLILFKADNPILEKIASTFKINEEQAVVPPPLPAGHFIVPGTYSYRFLDGYVRLVFYPDRSKIDTPPIEGNYKKTPILNDGAIDLGSPEKLGVDISKFGVDNICEIKGTATIELSEHRLLTTELGLIEIATISKVITASHPSLEKCK